MDELAVHSFASEPHHAAACLTAQLEDAHAEQDKALTRIMEQEKAVADARRRAEDLAREKRELEEALDCAGAELKRLTSVEVNLRKQGEGLEADKAALQVRARSC